LRFIHLSDLHIGKSVNGFSMLEEQRHVFKQVLSCIDSKKPEAVIIAGDVYDRAVPGVDAVRLFDFFLTELARRRVTVLIVSGNHDSPERLSFARRLLSQRAVYIVGEFDGMLRYVSFQDEYGGVRVWLMPFIKPAAVAGYFPEIKIESYDDAAAAVLGTAKVDFNIRNVLVSHQYYTLPGVSLVRCESETNAIGGLDAVDAGLLSGFDYAALGHLHRSQRAGGEHARYAGSPVKYSFSEWQYEKSALLVELRNKGDISIEALPLKPIHGMREIRGRLDELIGGETANLADREDYLRVILTDEDELVDPMGKLRSVYPNIMSLDFENTRTSIDLAAVTAETDAAGSLSPYDLFSEFFLDVQGSVMSADQARIVKELLETEDAQ